MEPIIRADRVSKRHRIGERVPYRTLRDSIARLVPRGRRADPEANEIWALKDVSFRVSAGEVVGVIGGNGAGKSTLLKILSRITRPTAGEVSLRGRVGSLLEIGSGFHPELTGRENIFLNGAILGMRWREIAARFDEIVEFSGVERFIDTPVKHYSSGMYLRLGFSVAAHLDTDILLIDEVLAVGDTAFQRRCLGKMEEVGRTGRTVLFVSHNVNAVMALCPRAIQIRAGAIAADGPSAEVVSSYLHEEHAPGASKEWRDVTTAPGDRVVRLLGVRTKSSDGLAASVVDIHKPVGIELEFEVIEGGHVLTPLVQCFNQDGTCVFTSAEVDSPWRRVERTPGRYVAVAWVPGNLLAEGTVIVGAGISSLNPPVMHVHERDTVSFEIIDSFTGDGSRGDYGGPLPGVVRPTLRWETRSAPDAQSDILPAFSQAAKIRR